jgi:tripartite-type tricarboxylate transporter receptor subunit TctC
VLDRLRAEMSKVVASPEVAERFEKGGSSMMRMSSAEAEAFVKAEIAKWPPIIRRAGISAD